MKDKLLIFCIVVWLLVFALVTVLFCSLRKVNSKPTTIEQTIIFPSIIIEEKKSEIKDIKQLALEICKYKYSWEMADEIFKQCEENNLPVYVIYALAYSESNFVSSAESKKACRGIFQISEDCLKDYNTAHPNNQYTFDEMYDVRKNIKVGVWHYQRYRKYVGDDWITLYAIYNNGYNGYLTLGTSNIQGAVNRFTKYLTEMKIYFY